MNLGSFFITNSGISIKFLLFEVSEISIKIFRAENYFYIVTITILKNYLRCIISLVFFNKTRENCYC